MEFRCYNCGGNAFRVLAHVNTVECVSCGKSSLFDTPPPEQPSTPPAFACPKCGAQSFTVLPGKPVEVACLKCGAVSPFSVPCDNA